MSSSMLRRTARPDRPRPRGSGYGWWRWNAWRPNPPEGQMAATAEGRRYCFHPYRMKRRWRRADDRRDASGRPADETIGASGARTEWSRLLGSVLGAGAFVRIRHTYHDEPALLMQESVWREMERRVRALEPSDSESPGPDLQDPDPPAGGVSSGR